MLGLVEVREYSNQCTVRSAVEVPSTARRENDWTLGGPFGFDFVFLHCYPTYRRNTSSFSQKP